MDQLIDNGGRLFRAIRIQLDPVPARARFCGNCQERCPIPDAWIDRRNRRSWVAQHEQAKPLKGFGSAGVLEVVEDWDRSTYRAVYTVRFEGAVFVLHMFQKKSKRGAATPKADIDLIRERLKVAEQFAKEISR